MTYAGERGEPRPAIVRVTKRDGREVPFDAAKIARAIEQAQHAVGESDARFAAEVAAVVELALQRTAAEREPRRDGEYVPTIEAIQDLVERALIELGRASTAKAYILYRDRRAQVRDVLRVREERSGAAPRVQATHRSSAWSKARVAAALIEEALLPRATAEEVARRVEQRVIELGLPRITSGLVRELVDIELAELGLTNALWRQEALKLPRHDLRRLLAGQGGEPWRDGAPPVLEALDAHVAERLVARYVLDDVLEPAVAELHVAGDLHIESIGRAHLPLWIAGPAALLAPASSAVDAPFDGLDELARWLRSAGAGVVLEDCGAWLAPLARPGRGGALSNWLAAASALCAAHDRELELCGLSVRQAPLGARLVELLADPRRAARVRLYVEPDELEALLADGPEHAEALEAALASGRLVPAFGEGAARLSGSAGPRPTRARPQGWLGCAARIAIHVPRIARRAGPWREDAFFEGLAAVVPHALSAARSIARFQREAAQGAGSAGQPRPQPQAALVLVGLSEALALLGGGDVDPALGARALGLLSEAAARFLRPGDCPLYVSTAGSAEAAARLAWLDAESARLRGLNQGELFPLAAEPREPALSTGIELRAGAAWKPGELEAELLAALPFGAFPPPARATVALERWRRFRARRARSRGADHGLLFPLGIRAHDEPASSERISPAIALDNPTAQPENS
ncbi:MAG: hypothetical protein EPO68_00230 [Planctomycetota bacterium]|nr:MAG: hypothetical protein EPO68_00230 [Planctomycetota bacterium]